MQKQTITTLSLLHQSLRFHSIISFNPPESQFVLTVRRYRFSNIPTHDLWAKRVRFGTISFICVLQNMPQHSTPLRKPLCLRYCSHLFLAIAGGIKYAVFLSRQRHTSCPLFKFSSREWRPNSLRITPMCIRVKD